MTTFNTLARPDGRTLAWAEYGAPGGTPLVLCHGWPGSRLFGAQFHAAGAALDVRLICADRPGSGASTFQPGRTIADWPADVAALADSLGVERLGVLGYSGGGPYALASAALLGERITVCGLVSPSPQLAQRGTLDGVATTNRLLWSAARRSRLGKSLLVRLTASVLKRDTSALTAGLPPDIEAAYLSTMREAYRGGSAGQELEAELFVRPWPFDPSSIRSPIVAWQPLNDVNVSPTAVRHLLETLPTAHATYPEGDDARHTWGLTHTEEILRGVLEAAR